MRVTVSDFNSKLSFVIANTCRIVQKRFSNHNVLGRSQLPQACEQSPKELTSGKEIEGRRQLLKGHSGAELHIYFLVHLESIYYQIFFYSKIVPNCAVTK